MKKLNKSSESIGNFDQLISKFSENEILNLEAMRCVKGGDFDGPADGGEVVISIPKPPQP